MTMDIDIVGASHILSGAATAHVTRMASHSHRHCEAQSSGKCRQAQTLATVGAPRSDWPVYYCHALGMIPKSMHAVDGESNARDQEYDQSIQITARCSSHRYQKQRQV